MENLEKVLEFKIYRPGKVLERIEGFGKFKEKCYIYIFIYTV